MDRSDDGPVETSGPHAWIDLAMREEQMTRRFDRWTRWTLRSSLLVLAAGSLVWGAQQSSPMTVQQDHQRIMSLLGITSVPPGPDLSNPGAYREAAANPYPKLPAPLVSKSGRKVTTADMWKDRREEIIEDFETEIYGRVPKNMPKVTWQVVRSPASGGSMMWELHGHVDNSLYPGIRVDIQARLILPVQPNPAPVIIQLVRGGTPPASTVSSAPVRQQSFDGIISPELVESIRLRLSPVDATLGRRGAALPIPPGTSRDGIPFQQLQSRGWGYLMLYVDSIQPDSGYSLTSGIIGMINNGQPRRLDDWGVLSAWAWGASRVLDFLTSEPAVDAAQIDIAGNAHQGTAALLAMAMDERIAIGYISSSGAGGVKLHRRNFGETIDALAGPDQYHRFAGNFLKYAGRWNDLPVDSHELIALVAPRPLFIGSGNGVTDAPFAMNDARSDPQGMFMAAVAAGPVYRLLGGRDLGTTRFPPIETSLDLGDLAFRQHNGGTLDGPNWLSFLTFADKYISRGEGRPASLRKQEKEPGSLAP